MRRQSAQLNRRHISESIDDDDDNPTRPKRKKFREIYDYRRWEWSHLQVNTTFTTSILFVNWLLMFVFFVFKFPFLFVRIRNISSEQHRENNLVQLVFFTYMFILTANLILILKKVHTFKWIGVCMCALFL